MRSLTRDGSEDEDKGSEQGPEEQDGNGLFQELLMCENSVG